MLWRRQIPGFMKLTESVAEMQKSGRPGSPGRSELNLMNKTVSQAQREDFVCAKILS